MNLIIFILYLIILVDHVKGLNDDKVPYEVEGLRSEFNKILGDALLNRTGSDIVKIGRALISDMGGSSCTRDVLKDLTGECYHISDKVKSKISLNYLACILNNDEIELPPACTHEQSWLSRVWTARSTCIQALSKEPSMWFTYDGFHRDIESVCFTQTFDKKLLKIETGTVDLIEAGQNLTTDITGLIKRVYEFEMRTMPYLQSIENGVHNTLDAISSLTTIVSKLYNLTERISVRVDVILVNLDNVTDKVIDISHDVSYMGSVIENNTVALGAMSGELNDFQKSFQKFFESLEVCRSFMTFINETFMILLTPPYLLLLLCMTWVWWYHLHGPLIKLFSVVALYTLKQASIDVFDHMSVYVVVVGCTVMLLMLVVIYALSLNMYVHRRRKHVRKAHKLLYDALK